MPWIYGNVNQHCPRANALGLSWFTAINPYINYYVQCGYVQCIGIN